MNGNKRTTLLRTQWSGYGLCEIYFFEIHLFNWIKEPEDLGWRPYVKTWIQRLQEQTKVKGWTKNNRPLLHVLFSQYIPPDTLTPIFYLPFDDLCVHKCAKDEMLKELSTKVSPCGLNWKNKICKRKEVILWQLRPETVLVPLIF